jgi:hypothetical protein
MKSLPTNLFVQTHIHGRPLRRPFKHAARKKRAVFRKIPCYGPTALTKSVVAGFFLGVLFLGLFLMYMEQVHARTTVLHNRATDALSKHAIVEKDTPPQPTSDLIERMSFMPTY